MKLTTLFAVAAVAALLAGCFTSEAPLLTDANSVAPYQKISFREADTGDGSTLVRSGKAYVTEGAGADMTMRFMPLDGRPDWYVVEVTGDEGGEITRLYAMLNVDVANRTAATYVAVSGAGDTGPGLRQCPNKMVCIDDLGAYLAHALAAIDAGAELAATYEITVE